MAILLPQPSQLRILASGPHILRLIGAPRASPTLLRSAIESQKTSTQVSRPFSSTPAQQNASPTQGRRSTHTVSSHVSLINAAIPAPDVPPIVQSREEASLNDLSCFPLPNLLRTLLIASISSSPLLLTPSLKFLSAVAYSQNPVMSTTYNPIIRYVLKQTLYKQFCAGETPAEVKATIASLKMWGIQGVLLGWAREVEERGKVDAAMPAASTALERTADTALIDAWIDGSRKTIETTSAGDMVSLKFTGAGPSIIAHLRAGAPPPPMMAAGLDALCTLATSKDVSIVIDAEQLSVQPGIERWSLDLMRRFNRRGGAVVFGTYQAYLTSLPARLSRELALAYDEGFALGVKLVRGAYLGSEQRGEIWATKAGTDACFDGIAEALICGGWNTTLPPPSKGAAFPRTGLVVATHNARSTQKALALQRQARADAPPIIHAQLMGMADHVSCSLVRARREAAAQLAEPASDSPTAPMAGPRPYKYLVWGSLDECLKYLVRRAEENRDAVERTEDSRRLLIGELWRRLGRAVGG